jgi:hypothetical protein
MGNIVPLFTMAGALRWIRVERYKGAMYGRECSIPREAVSEVPSAAREPYDIQDDRE